jgi:hypothetical protein
VAVCGAGGLVVDVDVEVGSVSMTSVGRYATVVFSRLGGLLLVALVVSTANDTSPLPVTSEVTSNEMVLNDVAGVAEATVAPSVGRLLYVNPVSVHALLLTDLTLNGVDDDTGLTTVSVTLDGAVDRPCTSNFRYDTVSGEPSTFRDAAVPKFESARSA